MCIRDRVEEGLDPNRHTFDPAIFAHFMAKNCPNGHKWASCGHKLAWRLRNGWSKSIVLENKVVINFDFRSGAKKSGHLDNPLQSYARIIH